MSDDWNLLSTEILEQLLAIDENGVGFHVEYLRETRLQKYWEIARSYFEFPPTRPTKAGLLCLPLGLASTSRYLDLVEGAFITLSQQLVDAASNLDDAMVAAIRARWHCFSELLNTKQVAESRTRHLERTW